MELKRRTFLGWLSTSALGGAFVLFHSHQVRIAELVDSKIPAELRKHDVLLLTPEAQAWAARHNIKGFRVDGATALKIWGETHGS